MKRNSRAFTLVFGLIATLFILCSRPAMAIVLPGENMMVEQSVLPYVKIQATGGATWTVIKNVPLNISYLSIGTSCENVDGGNGRCGIGFYDPSGNFLGNVFFDFMAPVNHYILNVESGQNPTYFVISDMKNSVAVRLKSNH